MLNNGDVFELTFNLTWNCPAKCDYCYRAKSTDNNDPRILAENDLVKQLRDSLNYNVTHYRFSGGEPTSIGNKLFYYSDIVFEITGKKPILMTSGILIDDKWMERATNKFSSIAISIDNPLETSKSKRILDVIKNFNCDELPFRYGLTLVDRYYFGSIVKIFEELYKNVDYKFMPQLDYPCLLNYQAPTNAQLKDLIKNTKEIFRSYGIVPYYFVYIVGSLLWNEQNVQRYVLNLHPEGNYQIHESIGERLSVEKRWRDYVMDLKEDSKICECCEWFSICNYHPLWELRYDWCSLRSALFQGILEGLDEYAVY